MRSAIACWGVAARTHASTCAATEKNKLKLLSRAQQKVCMLHEQAHTVTDINADTHPHRAWCTVLLETVCVLQILQLLHQG